MGNKIDKTPAPGLEPQQTKPPVLERSFQMESILGMPLRIPASLSEFLKERIAGENLGQKGIARFASSFRKWMKRHGAGELDEADLDTGRILGMEYSRSALLLKPGSPKLYAELEGLRSMMTSKQMLLRTFALTAYLEYVLNGKLIDTSRTDAEIQSLLKLTTNAEMDERTYNFIRQILISIKNRFPSRMVIETFNFLEGFSESVLTMSLETKLTVRDAAMLGHVFSLHCEWLPKGSTLVYTLAEGLRDDDMLGNEKAAMAAFATEAYAGLIHHFREADLNTSEEIDGLFYIAADFEANAHSRRATKKTLSSLYKLFPSLVSNIAHPLAINQRLEANYEKSWGDSASDIEASMEMAQNYTLFTSYLPPDDAGEVRDEIHELLLGVGHNKVQLRGIGDIWPPRETLCRVTHDKTHLGSRHLNVESV
jgi:hypothetical protein